MVELQSTWGWEPAVYLFLGGLAGGTFLVSAIVRFLTGDRFQKLSVASPWISLVALAVGLILLVVEVEKPLQAMMMWKSFVNFSSWMTIGAWLLFAAAILFFVNSLFSTPKIADAICGAIKPLDGVREGIVKVTLALGALCGLAVAVYTGILLGAAGSVPLWSSPIIPVLFTVSALDAGASVVLACLIADGDVAKRVSRNLSIVVAGLVILEALVLAALLTTLSGSSLGATLSVDLLLSGQLSAYFWGLLVVVGLAVPFVLTVVELTGVVKGHKVGLALHAIAIACALVGGMTLRALVVAAGLHAPLVSPDAYQAAMGVFNVIS